MIDAGPGAPCFRLSRAAAPAIVVPHPQATTLAMRSALTALVVFMLAVSGSALAQAPNDIDRFADKAKESDPPPMAFFLARGEPGACGEGCAEWIAADGTIDRAAGQRLRALLE